MVSRAYQAGREIPAEDNVAQTQDYDLGPNTFPRGWFMVADAASVTSTPRAERFFGQDLVLYRGQSGTAYMVDAYCPHMGTHLAKNTTSYVIQDKIHVEGDSIRCPYHAWRFGPDGRCDQIPYFNGPIPAAARIKSWTVVERYGAIFAWHDAEGGEPDFDLPTLPEWDDPSYVRWIFDELGVLPCHQKEIVDNIADVAHLGPTHGGPCEYFHNEIDGVVARQKQGAPHRSLAPGQMLETDTWYTGPGVLVSYFNDGDSVMFITHTPVEDGSVRAWHGLLWRSPNAVATPQDAETARLYQAGSLAALAQDFEIWANKRACVSPLVVPGDGAFGKVRIWYQQFFHPRALAGEFQAKANGFHAVRGMPPHNQRVA